MCAYLTLRLFVSGINDTAFLGILLQGALGGIVGVITIAIAYYLLHSPEMHEIYQSLHSKVFKTNVIASQEDVL